MLLTSIHLSPKDLISKCACTLRLGLQHRSWKGLGFGSQQTVSVTEKDQDGFSPAIPSHCLPGPVTSPVVRPQHKLYFPEKFLEPWARASALSLTLLHLIFCTYLFEISYFGIHREGFQDPQRYPNSPDSQSFL
jgi:hypothetical protein